MEEGGGGGGGDGDGDGGDWGGGGSCFEGVGWVVRVVVRVVVYINPLDHLVEISPVVEQSKARGRDLSALGVYFLVYYIIPSFVHIHYSIHLLVLSFPSILFYHITAGLFCFI